MTSRRRRSSAERGSDIAIHQLAAPIQWESREGNPILFADQLFVRLQGDNVVLSFGQAELPYEAQLTQETLGERPVTVRVVARLAVTPRILERMAGHMNQIYNAWLAQQPKGETHDSGEQTTE